MEKLYPIKWEVLQDSLHGFRAIGKIFDKNEEEMDFSTRGICLYEMEIVDGYYLYNYVDNTIESSDLDLFHISFSPFNRDLYKGKRIQNHKFKKLEKAKKFIDEVYHSFINQFFVGNEKAFNTYKDHQKNTITTITPEGYKIYSVKE